jgi:hypothetical protein
MDTADIVSSSLAALSLVVSVVTAYLTLLARFKCVALPRRRAILTQIDGVMCLVLECEFANQGAKPGSIEDMVVSAKIQEVKEPLKLTPWLAAEQFDLQTCYRAADLAEFDDIPLGAHERKTLHVIFRAGADAFVAPVGKAGVRTSFCAAGKGQRWQQSPVSMTLVLDESMASCWGNGDSHAQLVTALEIQERRASRLRKPH